MALWVGIFILLCAFSTQWNVRCSSCFSDVSIYISESEVKTLVDNMLSSSENIPLSCVQNLLRGGYFQSALYLYEQYFAVQLENHTETLAQIRQPANMIKKDLEALENNIMASRKEVQVVEPAFQWAQNKSHVFLQVKLAMRLDSPACLTCKEETVQITNNNLFMSAFGVISHTPVRFTLNLTLFEAVYPINSTWNYESVGTYFFSLAKVNSPQLWHDLELKPTRKVQLWWDMREKHRADMEEWSKIKEDLAEKAEELKKEARRKANKEKKQARLEQQKIKKEQADLLKKQQEDEERKNSWGNWFKNIIN